MIKNIIKIFKNLVQIKPISSELELDPFPSSISPATTEPSSSSPFSLPSAEPAFELPEPLSSSFALES